MTTPRRGPRSKNAPKARSRGQTISIDTSMDVPIDTSMDICMDTSMDICMDILKILVNAGGAVEQSGDHAKGVVRGQRMLPKCGRAVMC